MQFMGNIPAILCKTYTLYCIIFLHLFLPWKYNPGNQKKCNPNFHSRGGAMERLFQPCWFSARDFHFLEVRYEWWDFEILRSWSMRLISSNALASVIHPNHRFIAFCHPFTVKIFLVPRLCLGTEFWKLCLNLVAEPLRLRYEAEPRNERKAVSL